MKVGAIIQARMNSQRFPGKVLRKVSGKPLLEYILERLSHCGLLDAIVVATSNENKDDAIVEYCKKKNVSVFRGSLNDVAGRFKMALEKYKFDLFVRVNGDSPLIDQRLIDKAIGIFKRGHFDMVTNILYRSYPKGQSVEVLRTDTFFSVYNKIRDLDDREHVTKYIYKNKEDFSIFNFDYHKKIDGIQLSVDTEEDMDTFSKIIFRMERPHWEYPMEETLNIYSKVIKL